jgi:sterol desaturase/sphingolipid hydroxylase (fatty acid hydroxylase superfamily)
MTLVLVLMGWFLVLFLLEALVPLRPRTRLLVHRLLVNLGMAALALAVAAWIVRPLGLSLAAWSSAQALGLVPLVALPAAVQGGLAFLLMDLTFYYWHLANHQLAVLWRFHTVHHLDPDLDVSTALRFHPGEVLLSAGFRVLQVSLLGVSPLTYILYEGVFQACTLFHHSNVRLPLRAERLLNVVLVTPRMHGIHHSVVAEETNSNYATVFSWWDRLHRSMRLDVPQDALVIGVPAYHEPRDNAWWPVLALPFRPQRVYWCWPDGSHPTRDTTAAHTHRTRLVA